MATEKSTAKNAISPKLAITIDAINANPRLREFYETCCKLDDKQIKYVLQMMRAYKRAQAALHG